MTQHCANPECPGLVRDGVAPEYVDSVPVCLDCGERLMRGAVPPASHERPRYTDYTTVFIAADSIQANVVASLLRAEELVVHLKGEPLTGAIGELPANLTQIEVQVPSEDAERAREFVLRFERRDR